LTNEDKQCNQGYVCAFANVVAQSLNKFDANDEAVDPGDDEGKDGDDSCISTGAVDKTSAIAHITPQMPDVN
tara:strand:- start:206 stop:421 length:216 start_codon:yes stop_codon:yes gene_type:complete